MENRVDNKVNLKLTDMPEWFKIFERYLEKGYKMCFIKDEDLEYLKKKKILCSTNIKKINHKKKDNNFIKKKKN